MNFDDITQTLKKQKRKYLTYSVYNSDQTFFSENKKAESYKVSK